VRIFLERILFQELDIRPVTFTDLCTTMPDFAHTSLRDEEAYGGFDASEGDAFQAAAAEALQQGTHHSAHQNPQPTTPHEHAAYMPPPTADTSDAYAPPQNPQHSPPQTVQDVLIETPLDVPSPSFDHAYSSSPASEVYTPFTEVTESGSGDVLAFGGTSNQAFESQAFEMPFADSRSASGSAGSTSGNTASGYAGSAASGQSDAERLRFGFDSPKPSNQRIPPPVKKSWFANNGTALVTTAGLSLVTGGFAAYLLSSQSQSAQKFFNKLLGKDSSAARLDTASGYARPAANPTMANPAANTNAANGSSTNGSSTNADSASTAQSSLAPSAALGDTAQEALRRTDSLQAALQQRMGGGQMTGNKEQGTGNKEQGGGNKQQKTEAPPTAPRATAPTNDTRTKAEKLLAEQSRPKTSTQAPSKSNSQISKPEAPKQSSNQVMKSPSPHATKSPSNQAPKPALGLYAVQVHSTTSPLEAERVRRQLEIRGLPSPRVVSADVGMRFMYRVRFGSYATQQDAERAADRSGYADTWIVKVR
jgi:cell division protein FtsN